MKRETGRSKGSTSIHGDVKKKKERGVPTAVEERIRQSHRRLVDASSKSNNQSTLKSGKPKRHFIPPPARTSPGKKTIAWEGNTHRLEIAPTNLTSTRRSLKVDDLDTSEEEGTRDKLRVYERTIGNLMDELGTLRHEVSKHDSSRSTQKKNEQLNASKKLIEEQEEEIMDYRVELRNTLNVNKELKSSVERLRDDANKSRSEVEIVAHERDVLVKKLVEAEMDAKSTSHMVLKLKDTVNKLNEDRRMSSADVVNLIRQKEGLLRKLSDFEVTNKALRKLLKDQSQYESNGERLKEHHDILLQRLAETNEENKNLLFKLHERDKEIEALLAQVKADKNQAVAFDELKKTMEVTRAHLQKELRTREMECGRLNVQMKETNQQCEHERMEAEHMRGLVEALREKSQREKDALKKAARLQKDRAADLERNVNSLKQILDKELAEAKHNVDALKDRETKFKKEKTSYEARIDKLQSRVGELEQIVEHTDNAAKQNKEALQTKLQTRIQEITSLRAENERLKIEVESFEERLKAEEERNFAKIDKYRREVEEARMIVQEKNDLLERVKQEGHLETEKVRIGLQQRIAELEPVSELFKASERRLQDSQDMMLDYERRASDHKQLISELTQKVEMQSDQLEEIREKWRNSQEYNKENDKRYDSLERKYEQLSHENRDLIASVSRGEEALKQTQEKLDDKKEVIAKLTYQLEAALADARRQAESQREKNIAKERSSQARIADLEAQLSRATANVAQMKREKDEVERRFTSRLSDMRDRLDQANTTTRSMQNYVSFLKSSYSTVFDDMDDGR